MSVNEKYTAIIMSRDTGADLTKCIKSLVKQTIKPETILLFVRRSPYTTEHSIDMIVENAGIKKGDINVIMEFNSQSESGWDYNVTPPFEASKSMSRMRNRALEIVKGDNVLWIDADVQLVSTDAAEQFINAHSKSKLGENIIFSAPVRKDMWKYEAMVREVNPTNGFAAYRTHIDSTGPIRFRTYTDVGLPQASNDLAEYFKVDSSGSLVYMTKEWIKEHPEPFQQQLFGEWAGLADKYKPQVIIVSGIHNLHRSNRSHN